MNGSECAQQDEPKFYFDDILDLFSIPQALNLNLTRVRSTLSASSFFINENKIKH